MRRLLISPYAGTGGTFVGLGDAYIIQALYAGVLYWDEIILPRGMGRQPNVDIIMDYLCGEGVAVVAKHELAAKSGLVTDYAKDLLNLAESLWTDEKHRSSVLFPLGDYRSLQEYYYNKVGLELVSAKGETTYHTLDMAFRDALPAPPQGTPFQEVLEFKARRADQLKQLNIAMDQLAVQSSGVPSLDDAVRVGKQTVEGALTELEKVFSEKWQSRTLSTLRANLGSIVSGALMGAVGAPAVELPLLAGAAIGGTAKPLIQATINTFVAPKKLPEKASPYLYAYQAQRELGGKSSTALPTLEEILVSANKRLRESES